MTGKNACTDALPLQCLLIAVGSEGAEPVPRQRAGVLIIWSGGRC